MDRICVWCGLPSGEVPRSCDNHGKPRSVYAVPLDGHFEELYAAALAKLAEAVKARKWVG